MNFSKSFLFTYLLGVVFFPSLCGAESAKSLRKRKEYTNYHGFQSSRVMATNELGGDDDIIANIQVEETSSASETTSELNATSIDNDDDSKNVKETSSDNNIETAENQTEAKQTDLNEEIIPSETLDNKTTQVNVNENASEVASNEVSESPIDKNEDEIDAEEKDTGSKETPIEYEDIDDIAVVKDEVSDKADHETSKDDLLKDEDLESSEISDLGDDEKKIDEGSLSENNETELDEVVTPSDEKKKEIVTSKEISQNENEMFPDDDISDIFDDVSEDEESKPILSENSTSALNKTLIPTSWHEQIEIPYVQKDSLQYDFVLGCILAATFTSVVLMAGCLLTQFCDCDICCFESQSPHHWNQKLRTRKRFRLGERQPFFSFLKKSRYKAYDLIGSQEKRGLMASHQSVDSWASEDDPAPIDVNDNEYYDENDPNADIERLEYGESVESDYDDEVDYNLINHKKGRYDEEEIEEAAKQYFDEDRVNKFFTGTHSVDSSDSESDSDTSDPPLDMEMIQKKTFMSIKNAKAATRKLDGKSD